MDIISCLNKEIKNCCYLLNKIDWKNKKSYADWLSQTYYFVSHTSNFLYISANNSKDKDFKKESLKHLKQEAGHKDLLINDLNKIFYDINKLPVWPETIAFYSSQYYWIKFNNPTSHLAYSLMLEGVAATAGKKIYKKVLEKYGYEGTSFIRVHSREDLFHFKKGQKKLRYFTLNEKKAFLLNLKCSSFLYRSILEKIQKINQETP